MSKTYEIITPPRSESMCVSLINFKERTRAGESKNTGRLVEDEKVGGSNGAWAGRGRGGALGTIALVKHSMSSRKQSWCCTSLQDCDVSPENRGVSE